MTDLADLTARAEALCEDFDGRDHARIRAFIRDLLTYATTVTQERDALRASSPAAPVAMPEIQGGDILVARVRYRMNGPGWVAEELDSESVAIERSGEVIWRRP